MTKRKKPHDDEYRTAQYEGHLWRCPWCDHVNDTDIEPSNGEIMTCTACGKDSNLERGLL